MGSPARQSSDRGFRADTHHSEQQLHTFAKLLRTILLKRLQALRTSPHPPGVTKLEDMNHRYRIREGDCWIVFAIREKDIIVLAIKNGARREVSRA